MACGSVGSVALFLSWPALIGATREHPRVAKRLDFFFTLVAFAQALVSGTEASDAAPDASVTILDALGFRSDAESAAASWTTDSWFSASGAVPPPK